MTTPPALPPDPDERAATELARIAELERMVEFIERIAEELRDARRRAALGGRSPGR
jgi:hypothetical protein